MIIIIIEKKKKNLKSFFGQKTPYKNNSLQTFSYCCRKSHIVVDILLKNNQSKIQEKLKNL